ncbi:MAG: DUF4003 domain-containing protein [Coriobacteriia bacterium]|nr:DUF4003 domain-containing protein [Coriobacteriia bacterium]
MKQSITDRLVLFSENSQIARSAFRWAGGGGQTGRLMALIYALEDRSIDAEAVKESCQLIRSNTKLFSKFRGITSLAISAKLSLDSDPKHLFANTLLAHDRLREAKFSNSDQLTIAAFLIATDTERHNFKKIADRAKTFHDGMKGRWWFLTGQDDSIFSVMLALSDITPPVGIERVEQLYQQLKPEFKRAGSSTVQALSQVLALGGKSDEALGCLLNLNKALRQQRIRLDKEYTLPVLGILSLLSVGETALIDDILAAQDYLKTQKGFRALSGQERLLFSTAIISSVYAEECLQKEDDAVLASATSSIINIIIAQQIAVMMAIMAASAAGAAAASA